MNEIVPLYLRDVQEYHRLSGFSGADIFRATRDGHKWFVRKVAASVELSPRLRVQAEKQQAFSMAIGPMLHVPKILQQGEAAGRFFFDMEFVRGLDAVNYLRQIPYRDVTRFGDKLDAYLQAAKQAKPLVKSPSPSLFEALYSKLCDVQRKTQRISTDNLARLMMALDRLRAMPNHAPTLCHGDLTLQNLIVDEAGEIWSVDLLDTPYEHYWQDIAKLHQDLAGGWFLLRHGKIAQCVLDYLSDRTFRVATEIDPAYAAAHPLLLACTFARILPYAHTPEHIQFVNERIDFFTKQTVI